MGNGTTGSSARPLVGHYPKVPLVAPIAGERGTPLGGRRENQTSGNPCFQSTILVPIETLMATSATPVTGRSLRSTNGCRQ